MLAPGMEEYLSMSEIKRNKRNHPKQELFLLSALLIIGWFLRLYRLEYQSFWTDEIITIKASKISLSELIFHPPVNNNMPPFYFLMTHCLLKIDHHSVEWVLRFPSMLFGVLSLAVFYFIVRKFLGNKAGLAATTLMAISPFHIWYSQEARPYGLLLFLSLLSIWFFQELISKPQNHWLKASFIGSVVLTFYCHTIAIAFIGVLFIYVLLFYFKSNWRYWLINFAAIIILIIPALVYLMRNPPASGGDPHRSTKILPSIAYTIWTFGTGFSLGPSLTEYHAQDKIRMLLPHLHLMLPIMMLFSIVFILGVRKLYNNKPTFWLTTLLFICPLIFAILGSMISPIHPFNVRYSILSFPAFIIFFAFGVTAIKNFKVRTAAFFFIVLIFMLSLNNYYFNHKYHREDNRSAGQFLKIHAMSDDLVICSAGYTASNLRYYCNREDVKFIPYPPKYQWVDPGQIKTDVDKIINGRDRFWLFLSRTFHSDPKGHLFKYCTENYSTQDCFESAGVKLICFRKARLTEQ